MLSTDIVTYTLNWLRGRLSENIHDILCLLDIQNALFRKPTAQVLSTGLPQQSTDWKLREWGRLLQLTK